MEGRLIAFEGLDGTGKSTQITLLAQRLRLQGWPVVATREPTDGVHGQRLRQLFHDRERAGGAAEELELFIADRRQHVAEVIGPALERGEIVLTDRYYFSTAAYQGALGLDPREIIARNAFAPEPHLVLLLTVPLDLALRRIKARSAEGQNDFEREGQLRRVAAVYDTFAQRCLHRVDGQRPPELVAETCWQLAQTILPRRTP